MNSGDEAEQLLPRRLEKLKNVAAKRQHDISVLLENVHDPHNIGAVLRSADAVGIPEIYILNTNPDLQGNAPKMGKKTTAGTRRWVQRHYFEDTATCLAEIRKKYSRILATHLYSEAESIYDLDFTSESTCIVFGNEHEGVSNEILSQVDGNIIIPQYGMVESLNISVACAVTLFEISRQKALNNHYEIDMDNLTEKQEETVNRYIQIHLDSKKK